MNAQEEKTPPEGTRMDVADWSRGKSRLRHRKWNEIEAADNVSKMFLERLTTENSNRGLQHFKVVSEKQSTNHISM